MDDLGGNTHLFSEKKKTAGFYPNSTSKGGGFVFISLPGGGGSPGGGAKP